MADDFTIQAPEDPARDFSYGGGREERIVDNSTTPMPRAWPARELGDISSVGTPNAVGGPWRQTPEPVQPSVATTLSPGALMQSRAHWQPFELTRHNMSGQQAPQPSRVAVSPPPPPASQQPVRMLVESGWSHFEGHHQDAPLQRPATGAPFPPLSAGWLRPPGQNHPQVLGQERMPEGRFCRSLHAMIPSPLFTRVGRITAGDSTGESAAKRGPDLRHFGRRGMAAPPTTSDLGSWRPKESGSSRPLETVDGVNSPANVFAPRIFGGSAPQMTFATRSTARENAPEQRSDLGRFGRRQIVAPRTTSYPRPRMMNGSGSFQTLEQRSQEFPAPHRSPGSGHYLPSPGILLPPNLTGVDRFASQSATAENTGGARPPAPDVAFPPMAGPLTAPDLGSCENHESGGRKETRRGDVSTATGPRGEMVPALACCHGCRRPREHDNRPRVERQIFCVKGVNGGCSRWLCSSCMEKYSHANGGLKRWACHVHEDETMPPCPCNKRKTDANRRKGPVGTLQRSLKAKARRVPQDVFLFPRGRKGGVTYSVCTATNLMRVSVVENGGRMLCSRPLCSRVGHAVHTACDDTGSSALANVCPHGEAVQAAKTGTPIPTATPVFACNEDAMRAVEAARQNNGLGRNHVQTMETYVNAAEAEGVPVLVRIGKTGWFAVRQSTTLSRSAAGEWAHVKCPNLAGTGAVRKRRRRDHNNYVCKSNNGGPCSEYRSSAVRMCVHTRIVGMVFFLVEMAEHRDDDADANDCGPSGRESEGGGEIDEPRDEVDESGGSELPPNGAPPAVSENTPKFRANVNQLLKLLSIYVFPVRLPRIPSGAFERKKYKVHDTTCLRCGTMMVQGPDGDATLVTRTRTLRLVLVEDFWCEICGSHGWVGDNWRRDWVFNFNNKLLLELPVLYDMREAFRLGTPIGTHVTHFFAQTLSDTTWLRENSTQADRIKVRSGSLRKDLTNAYLAFEALTAHPYTFFSYVHGYYPEVLTVDACAKVATNNVSTTQFEVARQERKLDADRQHVQLKLSMMSPMVFDGRLEFVKEAAPIFSPLNRLGNLVPRSERGMMAPRGASVGNVDALLDAVGDGGIDGMKDLTYNNLRNIYMRTFEDGKGISHYKTKEALLGRLMEVWHTSEEGRICSKVFIARGSRASAGVEAFFSLDGVTYAHVFLMTSESPADVVDGWMHLHVLPLLTVTDVACMAARVASRSCPNVLENEGALPRDEEGIVNIPALQYHGVHSEPMTEHHPTAPPPQAFLSPPSTTDNIYALFARARPAASPQPHVDFYDLLHFSGLPKAEVAVTVEGEDVVDSDENKFLGYIPLLAQNFHESLHALGRYALSLFEVVVVMHAWLEAAGKGMEEVGGGRKVGSWDGEIPDAMCASAADFVRGVLAVSVGFTSGDAPAAPPFLHEALFEPHDTGSLRTLEDAVEAYHALKVKFIADGLQAEGGRDGERYIFAERLIRAGVGCGVAEHSVKALQIALSADSGGGGMNDVGVMPGYGISFNFWRESRVGEPHPYSRRGMFLGPDGPHEGNHNEECRKKYAGLSTCRQLPGVNLNVHEQHHSKLPKYFASLTGMTFDAFTFSTILLNELENASINRRSCDLMLGRANGHPTDRQAACCNELWTYGRCFCSSPVMRSFDAFGKMRITHLNTA